MNIVLKKRFWKISKWLGGIFIVLFLFRFAYSYFGDDISYNANVSPDFFSSVDNIRKNYASEKIAKADVTQQSSLASSQKYEKTASIKSKTTQFDKDQEQINRIIKQFKSIIQYEQNLGNKGYRQLHLLIGVNPSLFDSFYASVQHIGLIKSTEITKVDKTNEYKQLNAKKSSLEKTLASLIELKSRSGQITDYVALHDKILDIESRLQELGVELGNFDAENEFCTVRFSLYEGTSEKKIGVFQRIKATLEWTIKYYAVIIAAMLGISLLAFVVILIMDKLNIIKNITK